MKARYVIRITPQDIGRRVSVRERLTEGAFAASDTVGRLITWQDGYLVIERRDGSRVTVAESHLLAGRVIPERPERS